MSIIDPEEAPNAPVPEAAQPEGTEKPVIDHEPSPPEPPARVQRRGGTPLLLTLVLFAGLGGGLYWVWTHPNGAVEAAAPPADPQVAIDAAKAQLTAQLQTQSQTLSQQIQALSGRIDALEKQAAAPPPAAPAANPDATADLAKKLDDVAGQVTALAAKQDAQAADLQKLGDIAAQKAAEAPAPPPDHAAQDAALAQAQQQLGDLGSKLDQSLAQQKTALEQTQSQDKAALDTLDQGLAQQKAALEQTQSQQKAALDTLDQRLGKLEQGQGEVQGAAQDATRAIRLQAAQAALAAGQPVGDLPGAPQALSRFATVAPPTEAGLRAAFPPVAAAARAASRPDVDNQSFFQRALARMQQSVTVRQGDHVIVGDPAAGVIARAQNDVNNGDLKGAAETLGALHGAAADAVKDWVAQVHALLDARAALAAMAAHS